MDKVYISSPYRGNEAVNLEKARWYSRFAAEQGVIPVYAPYLLYSVSKGQCSRGKRYGYEDE